MLVWLRMTVFKQVQLLCYSTIFVNFFFFFFKIFLSLSQTWQTFTHNLLSYLIGVFICPEFNGKFVWVYSFFVHY
jgi:hypothetical protein